MAPSAESRNGTGPVSRQLQEEVAGVAPVGLFSLASPHCANSTATMVMGWVGLQRPCKEAALMNHN
jgi:hypothetical protein